MFQIQIETNLARGYNIVCSEVEIICHYSNSSAPGDIFNYNIEQDTSPKSELALELHEMAAQVFFIPVEGREKKCVI